MVRLAQYVAVAAAGAYVAFIVGTTASATIGATFHNLNAKVAHAITPRK